MAVLGISLIIFLVAAYFKFDEGHGSTSDADFRLLIPVMFMQFLNVGTSGLESFLKRPGKRHVPSWPKFIIGSVASVTIVCAFIAPILYVHVSPRYGQLSSFAANVTQAFMVLQLTMFLDEEAKEK